MFLTHMHFDHGNNLPAFPNASVYVQWDEFQGWCEALGLPELYTPLGDESWVTSSFDRVTMELRSRSVGEKAFAYRYLGWPGAPGQAEPD